LQSRSGKVHPDRLSEKIKLSRGLASTAHMPPRRLRPTGLVLPHFRGSWNNDCDAEAFSDIRNMGLFLQHKDG
jgi:hypothetical protein